MVALVERESSSALHGHLERAWRAPLAAGRALASALGCPLELLLVGPAGCREALALETGALTGVSRALCAELDGSPGSWRQLADSWRQLALSWRRLADAIGRLARDRGALQLLLAHEYATIEQLPLLAARVDAAMVSGAIDVEPGRDGEVVWSRPVHQGKLIERLARARGQAVVATVRAEGFGAGSTGRRDRPPAGDRPTGASSTCIVEGCTLELAGRDPWASEGGEAGAESAAAIEGIEWPGIEWLGDEEDASGLDLAAADRIVAVGRGLGDPERLAPIRELARALGAELAGSRPVVDAGWLERERQVGSSGSTVAPELYLALGISGSAQHLAGMSTSRCIVAINRDPEAPIFRVAHLGVVGDLHELVRELLQVLDATGPTARAPSS